MLKIMVVRERTVARQELYDGTVESETVGQFRDPTRTVSIPDPLSETSPTAPESNGAMYPVSTIAPSEEPVTLIFLRSAVPLFATITFTPLPVLLASTISMTPPEHSTNCPVRLPTSAVVCCVNVVTHAVRMAATAMVNAMRRTAAISGETPFRHRLEVILSIIGRPR